MDFLSIGLESAGYEVWNSVKDGAKSSGLGSLDCNPDT